PLRDLPRRRAHRAPLPGSRRAARAGAGRLQRPDPQPGDRAHRSRVAQRRRRALRLAAAPRRAGPRLRRGGRLPARVGARRPLRHLPRRAPRAGAVSSVLTWTAAPATRAVVSARLRALEASHHAMWNYVTYRDAIGLLGLDADELY